MLQQIYTVITHTYWEHFGSQPSKYEFNTKAEANTFANKFESDYFMEEGYYADVYKTTRVVITPEEEAKRLARQELRKTFNYKEEAYAYGVYTFWDGSKERYFIIQDNYDCYHIYFIESKTCYRLAIPLDYYKNNLSNRWCLSDGEHISILGGTIKLLPEVCQEIDVVKLLAKRA
jgi:hypothetical protein